MSSSHRNGLKTLLDASVVRKVDAERRLLAATDDKERARLIDLLASLQLAHEHLFARLREDDDHSNSAMSHVWLSVRLVTDAPRHVACDKCGLPADVKAVERMPFAEINYLCYVECERCGHREIAAPATKNPDESSRSQ